MARNWMDQLDLQRLNMFLHDILYIHGFFGRGNLNFWESGLPNSRFSLLSKSEETPGTCDAKIGQWRRGEDPGALVLCFHVLLL